MSGHSKWSKIKHQKAVGDVNKGQIFTKLAKAITISVRENGSNPDPETNFHLRLLVEKAKSANMPKDNIVKAIERGVGKGGKDDLNEVVYEGYCPGGVAVMIEALTDNHARTAAEIKNIFDKNGGKFGEPGSVSFLFKPMGEIIVDFSGKQNYDDALMEIIDAGAVDVDKDGDRVIVYTSQDGLFSVKNILSQKGMNIISAEEVMEPVSPVKVENDEEIDKIVSLIEKFESHDDVQKVHTNLDIP